MYHGGDITWDRTGGGIQQVVYLLGSFGIPLFFLINGYLLSEKNINFKFANERFYRFLKFIIMWAIICGIPLSIIQHRFLIFDLIRESFCGKGLLFHLWFLGALAVIYYIEAGIQWGRNYIELSFVAIFFVTCIMLSIVFFVNLIIKQKYNIEIRDIIPPSFRIITNGSFFALGFHIKKIGKKYNKAILIIILSTSVLGLNILSSLINNTWASTMYASIPVVTGVIALFLLVRGMSIEFSPLIINILSTSTGIWILHPFILRIVNKIYRMLLGKINLPGKIFIVILTLGISGMITYYIKKNKYLSRLIKL